MSQFGNSSLRGTGLQYAFSLCREDSRIANMRLALRRFDPWVGSSIREVKAGELTNRHDEP
jgi:hypothetical protein